jgi:glycosyltransferase involved in cell wall biosynthesis
MRIALVVPGFSADPTDWCIPALRHLVRSLAPRHEVRVLAVRYPYQVGTYAIDGARVIALGGGVRRGPATAGLWRAVFETLRREHRRQPFDVLHAFWATESGLLTALAGRWLRVPTVVSVAGGELVRLTDIGYGDQRRLAERVKIATALRAAGTVTVGSHYLARLAARRLGRGRVRWAPLGVDTELFSLGPLADRTPRRLVHAGTLTAVKDQPLLLRAFAGVRRRFPDAVLDVVGDGPARGCLEALAGTLGAGAGVRFRGELDHAALPPVYRGGQGFVLCSRHEAQGMVALEAAACGVPVFGTRVGVVPELAGAPTDVVDVGDAAGLAEVLAGVLTRAAPGPDLPARAVVERDFALPVAAARFTGIYEGLARG